MAHLGAAQVELICRLDSLRLLASRLHLPSKLQPVELALSHFSCCCCFPLFEFVFSGLDLFSFLARLELFLKPSWGELVDLSEIPLS